MKKCELPEVLQRALAVEEELVRLDPTRKKILALERMYNQLDVDVEDRVTR